MTTQATRIEHDLLGDKAVPADAYYGVQTARALENFHISGVELRLYPERDQGVRAWSSWRPRAPTSTASSSARDPDGHRGGLPGADRRQAPRPVPARRVPGRRRHLDQHERERGDRQPRARADGPQEGRVPVLQPARPRQRLAIDQRRLPERRCTSGWRSGNRELIAAVHELIAAFRAKGKEFATILKMGRTQLQDAVPMTLGQEFEAFGETLAGEVRALEAMQRVLCETNMGATAIGTGLNAPAGYAEKCTAHLAKITGLPIHLAREPDRGDPGHAGLRPLLVLHEEPGHQAVEGLQRPAAAVLRARAAACARSTCRRSSPARRSCPARSTR